MRKIILKSKVTKIQVPSQRHIPRDRRPSTAACPACWAVGTKELKQYQARKKIFCTGPTTAVKAEKKSLVPARQALRTNQGRTTFICTLWVPIHLSFNSQQGPPLYSLSVLAKLGPQSQLWLHAPPLISSTPAMAWAMHYLELPPWPSPAGSPRCRVWRRPRSQRPPSTDHQLLAPDGKRLTMTCAGGFSTDVRRTILR